MTPLDASLLTLASAGLLAPVLTLASIAADKANARGAWAGELIEQPEPPPAADPLVIETGRVVPVVFKFGDNLLSGFIMIQGVAIHHRANHEYCDFGPLADPEFIYHRPTITGEIKFRFVPPPS